MTYQAYLWETPHLLATVEVDMADEPQNQKLDNYRPAYEVPRAPLLGDVPARAGYCYAVGSGDSEGCTMSGHSASGAGCNSYGFGASSCATAASSPKR